MIKTEKKLMNVKSAISHSAISSRLLDHQSGTKSESNSNTEMNQSKFATRNSKTLAMFSFSTGDNVS